MKRIYKIFVAGTVLTCFLLSGRAIVSVGADSRLANLIYIDGNVEVQKPGGEWSKADLDMELGKDDMVRTGEDSLAEIELDDGSTIKLGEDATVSILALEEVGPSKEKVSLFKLIFGEIRAKVMKIMGKQAKFEVQTPTCIAGIRGTEFAISAEAGEAANVEVIDGTVVVAGLSGKGKKLGHMKIKKGQGTRIEKGKSPMALKKIAAHRHAKWKLHGLRKKVFTRSRQLDQTKQSLRKLRVDYNMAKTDEQRRAIQKQAVKLKRTAVVMHKQIEGARKLLLRDKLRHKKDMAKVIEKWKKLTPEQRKKAKMRMGYAKWKMLSPRLAKMRKERLKKAILRWRKLPPEARKRIALTHRLWRKLPSGQRKKILLRVRKFRNLPPWAKKKIVKNHRKWRKLPPGQRKKVVARYKVWRKIPPEARENWKDRMEKFRRLPPGKKKQMLHFYKKWQKVPPKARRAWTKKQMQRKHYKKRPPGQRQRRPTDQRPRRPRR